MPAGGNRNLIIGAIILAALLVIAAGAYFYTRRGSQAVVSDVTTDSGLRIQDLKIGGFEIFSVKFGNATSQLGVVH